MSRTAPLPLHEKLDRLFAFRHQRTESEMTNSQAAHRISQVLGRDVSGEAIAAARADVGDLDVDVLEAFCHFCGVDPVYLLARGDEDRPIDLRLHMWTLARDLGLHHMAARADHRDPNVVAGIIAELEAIQRRAEVADDLVDVSADM